MKKLSFLLSTMAMALLADPAHAAVLIQFTQGTAGVSVDVTGSIDPSSFTLVGQRSITSGFVGPLNGSVYIVSGPTNLYRMPAWNLNSFGPGFTVNATSKTGTFAMIYNGATGNFLELPTDYIAGSALSASLFYSGATFDSLRINPINFSNNLGGGQVVNVTFATAAAAAVPEPATWAMMLAGMAAIGFAMRRRPRQTVRYSFG